MNLAFSGDKIDNFNGLTRESMKEILENLTSLNYFNFNGETYRQIDGVSMGRPLSGAIANIFMSHHERTWLDNCQAAFKPIYYGRYIDDIFTIFSDPSHATPFFEYLNRRHSSINFTWETEERQTLPSLDVNDHRYNGSFDNSLYRKKTFTGLASNFDSLIKMKFKINLIEILLFRAKKICTQAGSLIKEINLIREYLWNNNFPKNLLEPKIRIFENNINRERPPLSRQIRKR